MALDVEEKNTAYRCGRLFAVLEKIQQDSAQGKLNAGYMLPLIAARMIPAISGGGTESFADCGDFSSLAMLPNRMTRSVL